MNDIIGKLNDGGPAITYTIVIALFVILALFIKGLISSKDNSKIISLISSIAWFAVAWGFLGRTIGLIKAFDTIQAAGELTPRLVSGGLKMALVGPLVGVFVFIIARIGIIVLIALQKEKKD